MEYQKYVQAKSLVTPPHIQPEWYYLAAYAVLRAIPKKLGGVVALALFVAILYFLPFLNRKSGLAGSLLVWAQILFWV